jgi:hypothetical protein
VAVPSAGRRFHARLVELEANYYALFQPGFQPCLIEAQVRARFIGQRLGLHFAPFLDMTCLWLASSSHAWPLEKGSDRSLPSTWCVYGVEVDRLLARGARQFFVPCVQLSQFLGFPVSGTEAKFSFGGNLGTFQLRRDPALWRPDS